MASTSQYRIKLCPRGTHNCARPLFYSRDLDINPMTLKLEGDLDILKMYFHIENEVARSRHSKLNNGWDVYGTTSEMKNTKILKVKGQSQMLPTSNYFCRWPLDIFLPSYINFRPAVFDILCGQTHKQTDAANNNTSIPARSMRAGKHRNSTKRFSLKCRKQNGHAYGISDQYQTFIHNINKRI